jgi:DNA recombination protein RmuC
VESFRALGVEVKRPISPSLAEIAKAENEPEDTASLPDTSDAEEEQTLNPGEFNSAGQA